MMTMGKADLERGKEVEGKGTIKKESKCVMYLYLSAHVLQTCTNEILKRGVKVF